jgi:hypothetical protein
MVGMSECHPFPVWQMLLFESFLSQVFFNVFFNEGFSSARSFLQQSPTRQSGLQRVSLLGRARSAQIGARSRLALGSACPLASIT